MSNLHFTPSPLATAKIEPKSSVTNQSNVVIILGRMGLGYGLGYSLGLGSGNLGSVPNQALPLSTMFGIVGALGCLWQNTCARSEMGCDDLPNAAMWQEQAQRRGVPWSKRTRIYRWSRAARLRAAKPTAVTISHGSGQTTL